MTECFSRKPSSDGSGLQDGRRQSAGAANRTGGFLDGSRLRMGFLESNGLLDDVSSSGSAAFGSAQLIEPDSLQGVVFACEGVEGATVLLNGPTGCKYYHSSISDSQTFRQMEFDPLNFPMTWYFGQPRVPCTYLDNSDYVYGSEKKLVEALEYFRDAAHVKLLCIVNSPGAALIGDDLVGIAERTLDGRPFMTIETPGFSEGMCAGHEKAACAIVDHLIPRGEAASGAVDEHRVNVLGLSLYQRHYTGDVAEIRRLLEAMGLTVGCVLCAGGSVDDVRELPRAALNVVVNPEFGLQTARHLQERFGTPYYVCDPLPIGFDATERMAREVAALVGGDAVPVLRECREARKRAFSYISRLNSLTGLPTGVPFAVEGTYSQLRAYAEFFVRYLAMVPVALMPAFPQADCARKQLVGVLDELGFADALGRDPIDGHIVGGMLCDGEGMVDCDSADVRDADCNMADGQERGCDLAGGQLADCGMAGEDTSGVACRDRADVGFTPPELFFGSGAVIGRMRLANMRFSGVETMLPSLGYLDVVPKTHFGPRGALQLVESVLNGLVF